MGDGKFCCLMEKFFFLSVGYMRSPVLCQPVLTAAQVLRCTRGSLALFYRILSTKYATCGSRLPRRPSSCYQEQGFIEFAESLSNIACTVRRGSGRESAERIKTREYGEDQGEHMHSRELFVPFFGPLHMVGAVKAQSRVNGQNILPIDQGRREREGICQSWEAA